MIRKLLGLILVSAVMESSFATALHHGVILDTQEWTSGSASFQVKEYPQQTKKSLKSIVKKMDSGTGDENKEVILLVNKIEPQLHGTVGEQINIEGWTHVFIENATSEVQTYKISSNFCADDFLNEQDIPCTHNVRRIQLDPKGAMQLDLRRVFSYKFKEASNYEIDLYETVEREGAATYFSTYDHSTIQIDN
ncbi:MAG: hypothetical protein P4L65_01725 [Legionella sp.]|nr:hypothetical protein [Legionella sp.]